MNGGHVARQRNIKETLLGRQAPQKKKNDQEKDRARRSDELKRDVGSIQDRLERMQRERE